MLELMKRLEQYDPIACVSWALDVVSMRGTEFTHRGPSWNVGFHFRDQVPADNIVEIAGIPFIFSADAAPRLDGALLDVVNGRFVVNERAPGRPSESLRP